jgi:hypothetical protein
LSRLEQAVSALVERLDNGDARRWGPDVSSTSPTQPPPVHAQPGTPSAAPVFLIRDVASQVGVQGQHHTSGLSRGPDIIESGLVTAQDATALVELFVFLNLSYILRLIKIRFQEHYGRWVLFNETVSPETLLAQMRVSPLLLCACCLIAVRHTTQESASNIAPRLFQEAKALLTSSLLNVPQSIEFFRAAVLLSMWSTTIGQTPLSIDSWLLSGFALQHSLASDVFAPVTRGSHAASLSRSELDRWCIWNHLCLVHLQ